MKIINRFAATRSREQGHIRIVLVFFALAVILAGVAFVNHWQRVDGLEEELLRLHRQIETLDNKVKVLELKGLTEEALIKPN